MASPDPRSLEADNDPSIMSLQGRFHDINLSGASSGEGSRIGGTQWDNQAHVGDGRAPMVTGHRTSTGSVTHHESASRGGKRRPNQAQRRQMSSQLSIPVDPRPQQSYRQPDSGSDFQGQSYRQFANQRFPYSHTPIHPAAGSERSAHSPQGGNQWHGASRNRSTTHQWNSQSGQYGYQSHRSSFHHEGRSSDNPRHDPVGYPTQRHNPSKPGDLASQAEFLERLTFHVVSRSEIEVPEIAQKEVFRQRIETICRDVISHHEQHDNNSPSFPASSVELKCFGSLSSGFATKASDMDLGLLSPLSKISPDAAASPVPRLLEKAFLDAGLGARLLSRTRVPIIKLCEEPPECLRQALMEARNKWETGDGNEAQENAIDDDFGGEVHCADDDEDDLQASPSKPKCGGQKSVGNYFEIPCSNGGAARKFNLYQGPEHSLPAYYGLAKRVLRKAGGRDVTISNHRDFAAQDWIILNRVCQAFVQGLSDPSLRERLMHYPSLTFQTLSNAPTNRSLLGVFTQVEGEATLQTWEGLLAQEAFANLSPQAEQALSLWTNVQWKTDYGVDPVCYTKDLQLVLDKIKKIPSVQLVLLEQGQHETPLQYFSRARGLWHSLCQGPGDVPDAIRQELIKRYILGIANDNVRKLLEQRISQASYKIHVDEVGLWHKSIHLLQSLDRALKKGSIKMVHAQDLSEYLLLLQSPARSLRMEGNVYNPVIPVPPALRDAVTRIRQIEGINNLIADLPPDKYRDPLEFPTSGVGVQCDINFSALLALHNTALLRCYSLTDPRVRPMVLFVKHWAKMRGINSGYRGTLSSYGYVLMVLHYLVNVVKPFVCPNLQQLVPQQPANLSTSESDSASRCQGCDIRFWRNENEIMHLAANNQLNHNADSIGHLLRGFFEYYAHNGVMSSGLGKGFDWGRDVLSLRTPGGLLTKQRKGWTGAKTVFENQGPVTAPGSTAEHTSGQATTPVSLAEANGKQNLQVPRKGDVKEVRHRFLFAIEDPFELDHNVARTVTHNGIVSIRDEFRRAWRIIRSVTSAGLNEDLLEDVKDIKGLDPIRELMNDIHGPENLWGATEVA